MEKPDWQKKYVVIYNDNGMDVFYSDDKTECMNYINDRVNNYGESKDEYDVCENN